MAKETYFLHDDTVKLEIDHTKTRHRYTAALKLPTGKWGKPEIIDGATHYLEVIPKNLGPWYAKEASQYWFDEVMATQQLGVLKMGAAMTFYEAKGAADRKARDGRNKGTDMHTALECYFKGDPIPDMMPPVEELFKRVTKWWESSGWKFIGCEQPVYSKLMRYGGKIDLEATTKSGKRVICDFKSTKLSRQAPHGVYLEMFVQGGGYAEPRQEEGIDIDDIVILNPNNVDADGNMVPVFASDIDMAVEDCIHAFATCKSLTDILGYWEPKLMRKIIEAKEASL